MRRDGVEARFERRDAEWWLVDPLEFPAAPAVERMAETLRTRLGVRITVELVPPGATAALTGLEERQKPRRLVTKWQPG